MTDASSAPEHESDIAELQAPRSVLPPLDGVTEELLEARLVEILAPIARRLGVGDVRENQPVPRLAEREPLLEHRSGSLIEERAVHFRHRAIPFRVDRGLVASKTWAWPPEARQVPETVPGTARVVTD